METKIELGKNIKYGVSEPSLDIENFEPWAK